MEKKRGQYVFELKNINYEQLIDEYYLSKKDEKNVNEIESPIIEYSNTEQITELADRSVKPLCFFDINKNKITMWTTMVDYSKQKHLPLTIDKPCWWCRYTFKGCPLGLPVKYHSNGNKTQMTESMTKFLKERNFIVNSEEFFETEGIFCSFPCCKAYIIDKGFRSKYKNSTTLLSMLYYTFYGKYINIPTAGDWRLLEKSCGPFKIEKFRNFSDKLIYKVTPNVKRPFMFAIGDYIQEIKVN